MKVLSGLGGVRICLEVASAQRACIDLRDGEHDVYKAVLNFLLQRARRQISSRSMQETPRHMPERLPVERCIIQTKHSLQPRKVRDVSPARNLSIIPLQQFFPHTLAEP